MGLIMQEISNTKEIIQWFMYNMVVGNRDINSSTGLSLMSIFKFYIRSGILVCTGV